MSPFESRGKWTVHFDRSLSQFSRYDRLKTVMSHHIAMTAGMNENLLDVGVQSYLKKLIHTVVLQQERFLKSNSGFLIGLESKLESDWLATN